MTTALRHIVVVTLENTDYQSVVGNISTTSLIAPTERLPLAPSSSL